MRATQPEVAEALDLDHDGPMRRKFLARLQGEISKRGRIDLLRRGVKDGPHNIDLFYGAPWPDNPAAAERYEANRFSITRQLRYKQMVADAVEQYKRDRDPREKLFEFERCVVHSAMLTPT